MNKRFENKTAYDPGRFRYPVTFIQMVTVLQPDGSQGPAYSSVISVRAVREPITRRFNVLGDMTVQAGEDLLNNYWYFTIRYRKDFTPKKDMLLSAPDGMYTVNSIPELDAPPHYWRMLCVKTDTTFGSLNLINRFLFSNTAGFTIDWQTDIPLGQTQTFAKLLGNYFSTTVFFGNDGTGYVNAGNEPVVNSTGGVINSLVFDFGSVQSGYIIFYQAL